MIVLAFLAGIAAQDGPISKFSDRAPAYEGETERKLEDVERCMIDMRGQLAPSVYRQPDRPDAVTLIWTVPNGQTAGRVDLARVPTGTKVVAWLSVKQITSCAPAAPMPAKQR